MDIFDGHGFGFPSTIDSKEMLNYRTERSLDATFQGVWVKGALDSDPLVDLDLSGEWKWN